MPLIGGGSVGTGSGALTYVALTGSDGLISRCRWRLEDRPTEDQTAGTITSSATTLAVDTYGAFNAGDWFEWDDTTTEEALVASTPGSSPITIVRGHLGSTAAAHSDDVRLLIRPRYPKEQLLRAIKNALASLWPRAYSPVTQTLTPSTTQTLLEANSDAEGVITAVQMDTPSTLSATTYGGRGNSLPLVLRRGFPAATFSSGKAWEFPQGYGNTTNTILVTYPAIPSTSTIIEGEMAEYVVARACAEVILNKQAPRVSEDMGEGDTSTSVLDMARLAAQFRQEAAGAMARLQADLWHTYGYRRWLA